MALNSYFQVSKGMKKDLFDNHFEHTDLDYPVGVYYIDLDRMYSNCVRPHWHEEMEIDLVREGQAVFTTGGNTFNVSAGEAVWINRNRLHSIKPYEDAHCVILSILFHPSYIFDHPDAFLGVKYFKPLIENSTLTHLKLTRNDLYGQKALERINEILEANLNSAFGYELETKSSLCSLWLQLLEMSNRTEYNAEEADKTATDEIRLQNAILYIHDNFTQKLTLDEIADSIHVSKSECCRCFKRSISITPFDYLMQHRIYESALMLQRDSHGTMSIQELARQSGFNNASYYNKIFKKYLGCTPMEYRETIKKSHRDALNPFGIPLARL